MNNLQAGIKVLFTVLIFTDLRFRIRITICYEYFCVTPPSSLLGIFELSDIIALSEFLVAVYSVTKLFGSTPSELLSVFGV